MKTESRLQEGNKEDIKTNKSMDQKHQFIALGKLTARISHELYIPLIAIKDAAYLLNMSIENPEAEVRQSLTILEENIATSERIINNLLEYVNSKPIKLSKVDINDLLRLVLSNTSIPNKIEMVLQLSGQMPEISADPKKLVQVFQNLIANAIVSMPAGGYLIIKSKVLNQDWIAISFQDTGMGVRKENLKKLFDPPFPTKSKEIGVGLAVSKSLVERHGGKIKAGSEYRKGCSLTVQFPRNPQQKRF